MAATLISRTCCCIIALAPLVGAWSPAWSARRSAARGAHWVTILGVLVSFIGSALVLNDVAIDGARFNATVYEWMVRRRPEDGDRLPHRRPDRDDDVRRHLRLADGAHLHHRLHGDDDPPGGYQRFFTYISLFTFSMLMLVMSNNFLQLFFGWEAVGLVSLPADRLLVSRGRRRSSPT